MGWINIFGLVFMVIIMIPNVIFALKCKDGFGNRWKNKAVEVLEQIGRYGCFAFMVINIPNTNSRSTYRQTLGYNKFILRQAPLSGDSLSAVAFLD